MTTGPTRESGLLLQPYGRPGNPSLVMPTVLVWLLAVMAALAVACGDIGDDRGSETSGSVSTPVHPSTGSPSPPEGGEAPSDRSIPRPDDTLAPEPTPTFDPGDVILPTVSPPTAVPDALEHGLNHELDGIAARASVLRGLYAVGDIQLRFISREELRDRVLADLGDQRDELSAVGRLYEILGVIDSGTDIYELFVDLYSENALGFFDTAEDELYVVDEDLLDLSPQDRLTYVHEFVHALQSQHFDIGSMLDSEETMNDADRRAAYLAMVEGDAVLLQTIYMLENMTEQEQAAAQGLQIDMSTFLAAPHLIQRVFVFPYVEGAQFVYQFFVNGGWREVNALYGRAPTSTEQIIHPVKYMLQEEPVDVDSPSLAGALGEGWSELKRDTFGEFALLAYLEDGLVQREAATAAAGWGGDEYVVYSGPDDLYALVHRYEWDSLRDAEEFFEGFSTFTEARAGATMIPLGSVETEVLFALTGQLIYAANRGIATEVVIAPDQRVLDTVIGALVPATGSTSGEAAESPKIEAQVSGDTGPDKADGESEN